MKKAKKLFELNEEGTKFFRKYSVVTNSVISALLVASIIGGFKVTQAYYTKLSSISRKLDEASRERVEYLKKISDRDSLYMQRFEQTNQAIKQLYQVVELNTSNIKSINEKCNYLTEQNIAQDKTINILSRGMYLRSAN